MSVCVLAGYALSDAAADGRWEHRKRRGVCSRVSGRGVCEYVCVSACSEAKEQKQVRRISSSRERVRAKARESASTMRRQLSPCSVCLSLACCISQLQDPPRAGLARVAAATERDSCGLGIVCEGGRRSTRRPKAAKARPLSSADTLCEVRAQACSCCLRESLLLRHSHTGSTFLKIMANDPAPSLMASARARKSTSRQHLIAGGQEPCRQGVFCRFLLLFRDTAPKA